MSKVVNITDKLNFEENPALQIGDMTVEVHADAETVLRLMGTLKGKDDVDINAVTEMMELLFEPGTVEKLCAMEKDGKKLSAKSLPNGELHVNMNSFPDAVCALAAIATKVEGTVVLEDAAVCRRKETDRH